MTVVIAVGVPGVGKTSVINAAIEKAPSRGLHVEVVNFGDIMVKTAAKLGLIESEADRDKMRKLPLNEQIKLQIDAANYIYKLAEESKGVVVVDTHVFIKTPAAYLPGIPKYILDALKPRGIIVITADPENVVARRQKDKDVRERDAEEIKSIDMHQQITLFGASAVSIYSGANLTIIENKEGKLEEAAEMFLNALVEFAKI